MNDDETVDGLPSEAELHEYQDNLVRRGLEDVSQGRVIAHAELLRRLKLRGKASAQP